jgi:hypothetical protein
MIFILKFVTDFHVLVGLPEPNLEYPTSEIMNPVWEFI